MKTSRRTLLQTLPAATLLASPKILAATAEPQGHAPWSLLKPLRVGDTLGKDCAITALGPIRDGGSVLTLSHPLRGTVNIHLCLHDGNPRGFAYTALFDLIVMDQGHGVRTMPSDMAAVLLQLQRTICDNELEEDLAIEEIAGMMTHAERVSAFGPSHLK